MQPNGSIKVTRHWNEVFDCVEHLTYEWEGGPILQIDYMVLDVIGLDVYRVGDRFTIGPYRLRVIENQPWYRRMIVTADNPQSWFWIAYAKLWRVCDLIYRRSILTLAVWGLASTPRGVIPSWHDIGRRKS